MRVDLVSRRAPLGEVVLSALRRSFVRSPSKRTASTIQVDVATIPRMTTMTSYHFTGAA